MSQDFIVKVDGLDEAMRMMNKADANYALKDGINWGMKTLVQIMRKYPSTSSANTPGENKRWYERGYGTRWQRADGSVGGRPSSHPLKDAWTTRLHAMKNPKGVVTNDATDQVSGRGYAVYVHGMRNRSPGQAGIHTQRGWKSLPEEGLKLSKKISRRIARAFIRSMKR